MKRSLSPDKDSKVDGNSQKKATLVEENGKLILTAGDEDYQRHLHAAGEKFLIVLFYKGKDCEPSLKSVTEFPETAQLFNKIANFVQIDLSDSSAAESAKAVKSTPTYIIYKNGDKIDTIEGFNPWELQSKINKHSGKGFQSGSILHFIDEKKSECLNGADDTPFFEFVIGKSKLLSDCDEQLILVYGFSQRVKLNALKIKAPLDRGPKTVKFFVNQTKTLGFDDATAMTAAQTITLAPENLIGDAVVELSTLKFQYVINLQVFVIDNMEGGEVTEIESIDLIGAPLVYGNIQKGGCCTVDLE